MFVIGFAPKKAEKIVISIRIEKVLIEKVDVVAGKVNLSRNEILCQSIKFALNQTQLDKSNIQNPDK